MIDLMLLSKPEFRLLESFKTGIPFSRIAAAGRLERKQVMIPRPSGSVSATALVPSLRRASYAPHAYKGKDVLGIA